MTSKPASASAIAAESPAVPVPMTRISASDAGALTDPPTKVEAWLLALLDGTIIAALCARVKLPRPTDPLARILDHFLPLRNPAGGAGNGEQHSEHGRRKAHRFQGDAGIEIDVWVELLVDEIFVAECDFLEFHRDVEKRIAGIADSFQNIMTGL